MDDEAERDALISQFCSVTGADPDQGKLYLESAKWNIDLATSSFFELEDEAVERAPPVERQQEQDESKETREGSSSSPSEEKKMKKSKQKSANSKFATLSSLQNEEESSEEEGQAFYAGGSEHSGQQMLGPKKKDPNELIQNMFKSAKEHGAQVVDPSESPSARKARPTFKGPGYKLGSDLGEPSAPAEVVNQFPEVPEPVHMFLKMWRNGFSVDDGPLRKYDDPESRDFLDSIRRGEVPRELVRLARGGEVNLNMEDHRQEEYVAPKKKLAPFCGSGQRLGGVAPTVEIQSSSTPQSSGDAKKVDMPLDESKPATNIQIRLADGSRLVVKLNLSHTVNDIRNYICNARPSYAAQPFSLMTTFPNTELSDESLTVEQAKLQNAVIVQRIK